MTETEKRRSLIFRLAFVVGAIGAFGQAFLLWHQLESCYPFKMMSFPSGTFFANIGKFGFVFAPLLALALVKLAKPVRVWLIPVLPVLACPILFYAIYVAACAYYEHLVAQNAFVVYRNFDTNTLETVTPVFLEEVAGLSLAGLCVALICGLMLQAVFALWGEKQLS